MLGLLARHETYCHCRSTSGTPPFGLVDWANAHHRHPTIEEGARIALGGIRSLLRRCHSDPGAVFGHWAHGTTEPTPRPARRTFGCWAGWYGEWLQESLQNWRWSADNPRVRPIRPARNRPIRFTD